MTEPVIDRPHVPKGYGVPSSSKGLLAWEHVERRLTEARIYWVATVGTNGHPRVRPVDGLYLDGLLYVGGSPETSWARDLAVNPNVSVHLDGGMDVVIIEGTAELLHGVDRDRAERLAALSNEKFPEYGMTADSYAGPGPYAIRPQRAYAWTAFPRDVTRFRFTERPAPD